MKALIYTTGTCAYCKPVKEFLNNKHVAYEEVDLDAQPERRQELLRLSGQFAVPVTIITKPDDSKNIIVGYNLTKLAAAIV